jgi:ribonuclease M5
LTKGAKQCIIYRGAIIIIKLRQAVIVEGKYDKAKLANIIDAPIITADGFNLFNNTEKTELIRFFARTSGIIILTDSDRAGFKIRGFIKGAVNEGEIINVYIPDIFGKERRKSAPGREGKLGVEGIPDEIIVEAFRKAGVFSENTPPRPKITKADLAAKGLSGGENASKRRRELQSQLGLPENLTAGGLLDVLNVIYSKDEFEKLCLN